MQLDNEDFIHCALAALAEHCGLSLSELNERALQVYHRFNPTPPPEPTPDAPDTHDELAALDAHARALGEHPSHDEGPPAPAADVEATPMHELPLTALPDEPRQLHLTEDTRVAWWDYERFTDAGGQVVPGPHRFLADTSPEHKTKPEPPKGDDEPKPEN